MAVPVYTLEIDFVTDPGASYLRGVFGLAIATPSQVYVDMTDLGDYVIQAGDYLEYDVYWEAANQNVALDLGFSDASYLRNVLYGAVDQNGLSSAPATDLSARANGIWYHRKISLGSGQTGFLLVGKTITKWDFAAEKTVGIASQVIGRIRDIQITDGVGGIRYNATTQVSPLSALAVDILSPGTNTYSILKTPEPNIWTDVSSYLRPEVRYKRGKQTEQDQQEAGTCMFTLDNRDRRFDPSNASSPYYPNVVPMRKFRLRAIYNSITYNLFLGFIERWPPEWNIGDAYLQIQGVDGTEPLNQTKVSSASVWPLETSDARVTRLLNAAGQNSAERNIDVGKSNVIGTVVQDVNIWSHMQQVVLTENGNFFYDGQGRATFQNRHKRITSYATPLVTFGNRQDLGEVAFVDPKPSFDKDKIYNDITVNSGLANPVEQRVIDIPSQRRYWPRTYGPVSTLLTTDAEALTFAQFLLRRYKQPSVRYDSIKIQAGRVGTDDVWPQIFGRELSDRVTVKDRPVVGGAVIQQDCHIEALDVTLSVGQGEAVYTLSPADVQSYWVLDSPTNSVLDSTTALAY